MSSRFGKFSKRQRWRGMVDFGRPQQPPMPPGIVFKDRSTGTKYLLSHDSSTPTWNLTSTIPNQHEGPVFEPWDGPTMPSNAGRLRLYVDSGSLNYERAPDPFDGRRDMPIYTRNFSENRTTFELSALGNWQFGDNLRVLEVPRIAFGFKELQINGNTLILTTAADLDQELHVKTS